MNFQTDAISQIMQLLLNNYKTLFEFVWYMNQFYKIPRVNKRLFSIKVKMIIKDIQYNIYFIFMTAFVPIKLYCAFYL